MRYTQIRQMDISNGEGIGVALFTQGCPFHCKNCFNPETWDFDGGKPFTEQEFEKLMQLISRPQIKRLTILGGEPLIMRNLETIVKIITTVKQTYPNKKIWIYTGDTLEHLWVKSETNTLYRDILYNTDILVDGPYIDSLRDFNLKYKGSSNQRIIDLQATLRQGKGIIEYL